MTIVGAGGPTGLAAAFFLLRRGSACLLVESRAAIGGALLEQREESAAALALDWPTLLDLGAELALIRPTIPTFSPGCKGSRKNRRLLRYT